MTCKLLQVVRAALSFVNILTLSFRPWMVLSLMSAPPHVPNVSLPPVKPTMPTRDQSRLSLVLTKELIDAHDIELLVEWLNSLSCSAESVFRYRDALRLSITGFDVPIPAMHPNSRMFFRRLSKRWPYWLHFIEKEPSSVGLLLVLLAEDQPTDPWQYPSRESLSAAMTSLLADVDRLYAAWDVPEPIAQANCDAATASYFEFVEANLSGRSPAV